MTMMKNMMILWESLWWCWWLFQDDLPPGKNSHRCFRWSSWAVRVRSNLGGVEPGRRKPSVATRSKRIFPKDDVLAEKDGEEKIVMRMTLKIIMTGWRRTTSKYLWNAKNQNQATLSVENCIKCNKDLIRATTSLNVGAWMQESKCYRCVLDRGYDNDIMILWYYVPRTEGTIMICIHKYGIFGIYGQRLRYMAFVFVVDIYIFLIFIRMIIRCVESISTGCSGDEILVRDQRRTTHLGFPSQDPENTSLSGLLSCAFSSLQCCPDISIDILNKAF